VKKKNKKVYEKPLKTALIINSKQKKKSQLGDMKKNVL
jgi:hypothetical protein